jgi:hypothetical protein
VLQICVGGQDILRKNKNGLCSKNIEKQETQYKDNDWLCEGWERCWRVLEIYMWLGLHCNKVNSTNTEK